MIIGMVTLRISIPEARSLKDKRSVLRSLKDRTVAHMNVSVAEIGKQDLWKSGELAFVTVGAKKKIVEQRLAKLNEMIRSDPRYVIMELSTQYL